MPSPSSFFTKVNESASYYGSEMLKAGKHIGTDLLDTTIKIAKNPIAQGLAVIAALPGANAQNSGGSGGNTYPNDNSGATRFVFAVGAFVVVFGTVGGLIGCMTEGCTRTPHCCRSS